MQLAYFSGAARLQETRRGWRGSILRFHRVRPSRQDAFQPLLAQEITPQRFDRICGALRRWAIDVVPLGEAVERALEPAPPRRRFVALTFDGAYRDALTHAYPVLSRHRLPFAVYIPTGFVDGIAPMWWLALEQVVARHERIGLVVAGNERHFTVTHPRQKRELFVFLAGWLRTLPPREMLHAVQDLCRRYAVDAEAETRAAAMGWSEVRTLARDPLVTIGSATVNHPVLTTLTEAAALREMKMGRQVVEAALERSVPHFAYPFGDPTAVGRREIALAADAGFASAVTARPGVIQSESPLVPHALPRLSDSGGGGSLRALRVRMSGLLVE